MAVIQAKNLRFCYDNICVLQGVDFSAKAGEFVGIIGPNGGGKTTFVKLLLNILEPLQGEIFIKNGGKIGYVAQSMDFDRSFPATVYDVVLMGTIMPGAKAFHKHTKKDHEDARRAVKTMKIEKLINRGIDELSTGELKKVLIARSLAGGCDILILDEPSAGLSADAAEDYRDILHGLKGKVTLLIVSHDLKMVFSLADQLVFINQGFASYKNDQAAQEQCLAHLYGHTPKKQEHLA